LLQICGVLLILCLPLSLAIPVFILNLQPEKTLVSSTFFAPAEKSRDETLGTLEQVLARFPDVILSNSINNSEWKIRLSDRDKEHADMRMNEAQAAITAALKMTSSDPLTETIRFNSYGSVSGNMAHWFNNESYVAFLRSSLLAGIVLSAAGLLCVALPRGPHSPPVSRIPGMISLGFFIFGIWGVYLTTQSFTYLATLPTIAVTVLTGVPAMVFGLSARSGRMGRIVAALSWCAILGLCVCAFLPRWNYSNFGWSDIVIPPASPTDPSPPSVPERSATMDGDAKQNAVMAWLQLIDAGKYAEAWNLNSNMTRTLESENEWTAKLKAIREPLGGLLVRNIEGTRSGVHIEGAPAGRYMVYTFKSDFASKHSALETVTLILQDGGKWRILGYSIQ
jgi:hypothetical protein